MNRLRGTKVIVEFEDEKPQDMYRRVGNIDIPVKPTEKGALKKGTITQLGVDVDSRDVAEGMTVYVREHQGERLNPSELKYLYRLEDIIAND